MLLLSDYQRSSSDLEDGGGMTMSTVYHGLAAVGHGSHCSLISVHFVFLLLMLSFPQPVRVCFSGIPILVGTLRNTVIVGTSRPSWNNWHVHDE